MGAERNHTRLTEQVTTLGSAERLLRSAPPPVRHVQCVTTASAGAVEVRLPGQPDGPVKFSKTQCEEEIMFQGAPFSFATVNILVMVVTVVTVITIPISAATTTVAMVMAAAIPTRRNKGAAAWPGDGPIIRSVMEACHEAILSRRVNADGYPVLERSRARTPRPDRPAGGATLSARQSAYATENARTVVCSLDGEDHGRAHEPVLRRLAGYQIHHVNEGAVSRECGRRRLCL